MRVRMLAPMVVVLAMLAGCGGNDDSSGDQTGADVRATVSATVTVAPSPDEDGAAACAAWRSVADVSDGGVESLSAGDSVLAAAVQAFPPQSSEYRTFVMQAGAFYRLAIESEREGGGTEGLESWLDARKQVRDAADVVEQACDQFK